MPDLRRGSRAPPQVWRSVTSSRDLAVEDRCPNRRAALHRRRSRRSPTHPAAHPSSRGSPTTPRLAGDRRRGARVRAGSRGCRPQSPRRCPSRRPPSTRGRSGSRKPPLEARAELLKRRAFECYLIDRRRGRRGAEGRRPLLPTAWRPAERRRRARADSRPFSGVPVGSERAIRPGGGGSARAASARTRLRARRTAPCCGFALSPRTTKEPWSGAHGRSSSRSASTIRRSSAMRR